MIHAFSSIKGFGVFDDFRWPNTLAEFKRFNIIYGWNYSGKTTLSRVFRSFELKRRHEGFGNAQVQLKEEDGSLCDLDSTLMRTPIRVFNKDFVKDNLLFDSGTASPVLVLGSEDIEKRKELEKLNIESNLISEHILNSRKALSQKRSDIDRKLANAARRLKLDLAIPNYDKTKLEACLEQVNGRAEQVILSEPDFEDHLIRYRSVEKKPILAQKALSFASDERFLRRAKELLARCVAPKKNFPHLALDSEIEKWVGAGRLLHQQTQNCYFCGSTIRPTLLSELAEYFSAEYESLMSEIKELMDELDAAAGQIVRFDDQTALYSNLVSRYEEAKNNLEVQLASRHDHLMSLRSQLEFKISKAFTSMAITGSEGLEHGDLGSALHAVNSVIREHNDQSSAFEQLRQESMKSLLVHYAALFEVEEQYSLRLAEIAELTHSISSSERELVALEKSVRTIEASLSEAHKGADRLNQLLAAYFGKTDIRIDVSSAKDFQISRSGVAALNLSEGEQTAIGFAYFITRVQDGRFPLSDQVLVIDDPISSLDANHIFNTYALIKTQLDGAKQLFLLTHNFDFYNLLREWLAEDEKSGYVDKPREAWKKWGAYLVQRHDNGFSSIVAMPKELLKFKSEYHYLFSRLHDFDQMPVDEFEHVLALPNLVRRFMEAFGGIMIPTHEGLHSKMPRLFQDTVERERVWKFINHYSHQTSITRSLTIPDVSEYRAVVRACLGAVKSWNQQYYRDLESEMARR